MSRTEKDKKWDLRHPENSYHFGTYKVECVGNRYDWETGEVAGYYTRYVYLDTPGAKTKKKRGIDGNWRWYQRTPSWWTKMTMLKPQRRAGRIWERKVLFEDIEETDPPGVGKKPHNYFY